MFQSDNESGARRRRAGDTASWLGMAASPTFALMAFVAANDAARMPLCASGSEGLPIDGMTAMYLLMSLFHLPPWLKFLSARLSARLSSIATGE